MAVGRQEPLVSRRMEKTAELTAQLTELRQMTVELPEETESDDSSSVNDCGSVNEASSGNGEWESDDADSLFTVKHLRYKLAASPVSVLDLRQQVTSLKKRGEEYDSDAVTTTSSGSSGELDPSLVLQDLLFTGSSKTAANPSSSPSRSSSASSSLSSLSSLSSVPSPTILSPFSPLTEARNMLPPPALSSLPLPLSSLSPPLHSSSLSPPSPSPPPRSPCPVESLALLDLSSTQSVLADVAANVGLADVAGIEQDLEYVRHVLLLSGFAVSLRKLHPRPVGKDLLKRIWVEIHDWPIPPSPDVYDVLDDAARRDMQKGVDRWSQEEIRDSEAATVAFDLEEMILDALVETACKEYSEVERERVERRRVRELQRKAAREEQERERRRWSIGGRACAAGSEVPSNVFGRTLIGYGSAGRMGRAATPQRGGGRSSSSERAAGKGVGLHGVDRAPARPTTPVRAVTPGRGVRAIGVGKVGQRPVGGVVGGDVDRRWRN
ncbi:unnamed protein product [Closterium sp. Naga37s-1]|nr:unnamed protein product [Closterium sp. Naga37s-1]